MTTSSSTHFNKNSQDKRVRVLHLITRMIVGGAQENTMLTAALLNKEHFDVEIICGPQTGPEGSLIEECRQVGIKIQVLPELVRELNPYKDVIAFVKLFRILKGGRYAIIHTHSSKAGILGRLAGKAAHTPIVFHTVHGWSFHDYMQPWLKKLYIILERITAKFTDRLIAVTKKDIQKGINVGIGKPEQYTLIRSAIPLEQFQQEPIKKNLLRQQFGIPQNAPVIGTISRLSPQKNPFEWVDIASEIYAKEPSAYFLFVGDGPLRQAVLEHVEQKGLATRIIFTGLRRDASDLLNCMDIFLLSSLWEGLPRVIPQAMCVGVPVVAYAVDGVSEIIIDRVNGIVCKPHHIRDAANSCLELINSASLREKICTEAYRTATLNFDLRKMICALEDLYFDSLQQKGVL